MDSVAALAAAEVLGERPALEDRLHVADPHRVLGVQLRLVEERRRGLLEEPAPGVVTQRVVVPEEIHQADPVSAAGTGAEHGSLRGSEGHETERRGEQVRGPVAGRLGEHAGERRADGRSRAPRRR